MKKNKHMNFSAKIGILATAVLLLVVVLTRGSFFDGAPSFGQNVGATSLELVPSVLSPIAETPPEHNWVASLPKQEAPQNGSTEQLVSLPGSQLDMSVVGATFPVSASVEASCKGKDRDICKRHNIMRWQKWPKKLAMRCGQPKPRR